MKEYRVTCDFCIEAEDGEDAYYKLLEYLADCVRDKDVTPFDFKEDEGFKKRNVAGQIVEPPKRDEWVNWGRK